MDFRNSFQVLIVYLQGLAYYLEPLNSLIYTWMFTDVLVDTYGGQYQKILKIIRFGLLFILTVANISLYVALAVANTKVTELSLEYKIREVHHWQNISNIIQNTLDILTGVISGISCVLMVLTVLHIRRLSKVLMSEDGVQFTESGKAVQKKVEMNTLVTVFHILLLFAYTITQFIFS